MSSSISKRSLNQVRRQTSRQRDVRHRADRGAHINLLPVEQEPLVVFLNESDTCGCGKYCWFWQMYWCQETGLDKAKMTNHYIRQGTPAKYREC